MDDRYGVLQAAIKHGQLQIDRPPGEADWVLKAHHASGPFKIWLRIDLSSRRY